jgi:hypothetical protein
MEPTTEDQGHGYQPGPEPGTVLVPLAGKHGGHMIIDEPDLNKTFTLRELFAVAAPIARVDQRWKVVKGAVLQLPLHSLLTGFPLTDHRDRDPLNNSRSNLRLATHSQNQANRGANRRRGTSRFKGVSWSADKGKWQATLAKKYIGRFVNESDAARAYDREAVRCYGEFACTNETLGLYDA